MPPGSITPLRVKRIALFALLIAIFVAVVLLIPKLIYRHPYVNTAGEIVFASDRGSPGQSHIFIAQPGGAAPRQLTTGAHNDTQPSFSPDGTQIAFVSDRGGTPQVYVMDANGGEARSISTGNDQKLSPQFSPDGQQVGYISRGQLIAADVIGGHTVIILPTAQSVSTTNNSQTDSDASGPQTSSTALGPVMAFAWCPSTSAADSGKIAAVQQPPDSDIQVLILVDPSDAKNPLKKLGGASQVTVAWSPDGKQLAAAMLGATGPTGEPQNVSAIADFDAHGGQVYSSPIAAVPSRSAGPQSPEFTASGSKLIFVITRLTNLSTPVSTGLGIADAQPGGQVQVAIRGAANAPQPAKTGDDFLFLGPAAPNSTNEGLFIADPPAKKITPVTTPSENVTAAEWSPAVPRGK